MAKRSKGAAGRAVTIEDYIGWGANIMNRSKYESHLQSFEERWIAHFEVVPIIVLKLWELLEEGEGNRGHPAHLLWALLWLKTYQTEQVCAGMVGEDGVGIHEDTFRDWSWYYVQQISYLEDEVVHLFWLPAMLLLLVIRSLSFSSFV